MGILRADRITGLGGANAIKGSVFFGSDDESNYNENLAITNTSDLDIGAGNYTIEYWFNCDDTSTDGFNTSVALSEYTNTSSNSAFNIYHYNKGFRIFNRTGGGFVELSNPTDKWIPSRWHHFAWVRSGTGTNENAIYVDGVSIDTFTNAVNYTSGQHWLIGSNFYTGSNGYGVNPEYGWSGHLSNVRVSNIARYSGAFTPPTAEYTVDSNTILLACQSPSNILQEATGKEITFYKGFIASSPPQASKFTPNSPVGFSTTTDVGSQYGSTFDGFGNFATSSYMVPPGGNTRERNRGRAVLGGGFDTSPGSQTTDMQFFEVQSQGNTQTFGDLTQARWIPAAYASSTRACFAGGGSPSRVNTIDFVTIANTANATDFGDLTSTRTYFMGYSSSTRGITAGGGDPSLSDVIDYVTIATAGDATDFGNLTVARQEVMSACSPTRGLTMGGFLTPNPSTDVVDYVTIASTGNAIDFGDLTAASGHGAATSDNTRVIFAGGYSPGTTYSNKIEFFTTASTGNGTDFGDLITAVISVYGMPSDNTRGVLCGGFVSPANINSMQQITIQTTGDAVDFGDVTVKKRGNGGTSDSHGGLS